MSSSRKHPWTKKDIPSLQGKTAIVTGATGGLGYLTAQALAGAGAQVTIAGRNEFKGQAALVNIRKVCPTAKVSFSKVDLCNLGSIQEFAEKFNNKNQPLDILVNNAGVAHPQTREVTSDGFELLLGTNYISHFALTARLVPSLRRSDNPRVVNVTGVSARNGWINFDDLQSQLTFNYLKALSQSKLAILLFTAELQRQSNACGWGLCVTAAHPGVARTDILTKLKGIAGFIFNTFIKPFISQSAEDGVLPQLYAATAHNVKPGGFYGPQGFYEMKGPVGPAFIPQSAKDTRVAKKLWDLTTSLTAVNWN